MTLPVLISLATLTFLFGLGDSQDCTALAATGNCDFYPQCVEARIPCGSSGYALNYGERNCIRFAAMLNCFTSEGQAWVNGAQICLMQEILNSAVYNNNGTCQELLEFAYDSHPDCYVDNGFCTDIFLNLTNLNCLIDVLDSSDILTRLGIQQIYQTVTGCAQQYVDSFLSSVDDRIQSVTGRINELLTTLRNLLAGCESGLDLLFVLDSSGSVGFTNFVNLRNFVVDVIAQFEIRANSTRVGVIRYSSSASIEIQLGSTNNVQQLTTDINNIAFIGGGTSTNVALDLVPTAFVNARINEGTPRVVILITDGQSNNPTLTAEAATRLHNDNIIVYAVGIGGNVNEVELQSIASDTRFVFRITDFTPGAFAEELRPLQLTACTTPAVINITQQLQISIGRNQVTNLEYNFPLEGLTITIEISVGELVLYGSFTIPSPSSLTADFEIRIINEINFFVSPELYSASVVSFIGGERRRRQISEDASVFITLVGQEDINTFSTTTALSSGCPSGTFFDPDINDCSCPGSKGTSLCTERIVNLACRSLRLTQQQVPLPCLP